MKPNVHRCLLATALACVLTGCAPEGEGGIRVEGAWVRAVRHEPDDGPTRSAAYLEIVNDGSLSHQLVGVRSDVAVRTEIHRTRIDEAGRAIMDRVDSVDLLPATTTTFEPGGLHVMLMGIGRSLAPGDTVRLTLAFDSGGELEVEAEVRPF